MRGRRRLFIAALLPSIISISACVTNPPQRVVRPPVFELRINPGSRDEVSAGDVAIGIQPITVERAAGMAQLFAPYTFWNPAEPRKQMQDRSILISLPAFEVQVANGTGQAISFQKVAIRLVDDAGNSYQPQLKQDVLDFMQQQFDGMRSRGWAVETERARAAARGLRLLDRNHEGLPGLTEKRILAFDLGNATNAQAYAQWLSRTKYLRVLIYNVPVKFDQAGNVTMTSKFEYLFDVVTR